MTLSGKTAIITGAARGIGRAVALYFAKEGANLVLNYRGSIEAMESLIKEIEAAGGKAHAVQGDVSDFESAKKIVDSAVEKFGSCDILVNNAGITKDMLLLQMKEADFMDVININLKGAFNMIKHASTVMLKQRSGRIVNIASVIGLVGNAGQVNYAASKAGVLGMTKSVAKELASRGITCNAVAPGFITSDMTDKLSDTQKAEIMKTIPLKRFGAGEDVAKLAAFLASDNASYITGQVICVDGGMVM